MKLEDHYKQTGEAKRFQEYIDSNEWANPGNTQGVEYDLESISTVPVSMYVGNDDFICGPTVSAQESERIPTL